MPERENGSAYGWLSDDYDQPDPLVITDVGSGCVTPTSEPVPFCVPCAP